MAGCCSACWDRSSSACASSCNGPPRPVPGAIGRNVGQGVLGLQIGGDLFVDARELSGPLRIVGSAATGARQRVENVHETALMAQIQLGIKVTPETDGVNRDLGTGRPFQRLLEQVQAP